MLKPINQMSWLEVDALDRSRLAYVLPVGSTEQHGRHLPVGTDDLILQTSLDGLEKHLKTENTFLRLPTLHYPFQPCFGDAESAAKNDQLDALSLFGSLRLVSPVFCASLSHTDIFPRTKDSA